MVKHCVVCGAPQVGKGPTCGKPECQHIPQFGAEVQPIFLERNSRYGGFHASHENLGLLWTGLIQNHFKIRLPGPIPSSLVLLMMVASKINRAAIDPAGPDNYIDGEVYLRISEQSAKVEADRDEKK